MNASLSISEDVDGRPLVHCFAGCSYARISDALALRKTHHANRREFQKRTATNGAHAERRFAAAARLWQEAAPADGTVAERYLRTRGIRDAIPETLRFHPNCPHPSRTTLPALVAAVADVGMKFRGIHRIFLRGDGLGKSAIEPSKASLGLMAGGMVPLTPFTTTLAIGEGIETTLSVMTALFGDPRFESYSFAAALSTSGLRTLQIPTVVRQLVILADRDEPGERAAQALALKALRGCRQVRIARPTGGKDFNDMSLGRNE
jgi:hypothetical protein